MPHETNHAATKRIRYVTPAMIRRAEVRDVFARVENFVFHVRISKGEAVRMVEEANAQGREVSGDYVYSGLYLAVRD